MGLAHEKKSYLQEKANLFEIGSLEKAKEEKQAAGEIETEHPGYLIAQDTFYVGIASAIKIACHFLG